MNNSTNATFFLAICVTYHGRNYTIYNIFFSYSLCIESQAFHTLAYPIEHGVVTNWDDMEKVRPCRVSVLRSSCTAATLCVTDSPSSLSPADLASHLLQ